MKHFLAEKCENVKISENLFDKFFQKSMWWQSFKKKQKWLFFIF